MNGICVYCASSNLVDEAYFEAAREIGRLIAASGAPLVYGGGNVGLMGTVARAVHAHGGAVIGVIPEALRDRELAYTESDELIITPSLRERKAVMELRSDAFIALPGGCGTLEEILEAITLKQLGYHRKPIVFLNTNGFYDPLLAFFERLRQQRFSPPESEALFYVATTPWEAMMKAGLSLESQAAKE